MLVTDYFVSYGSTGSIYRQLADQVRRRIVGGQLKAGSEIPSVRDLAHALDINPMTVSKALGILLSEGLVARRRGLSMVVANRDADTSTTGETKMKLLRPLLERAATEADELRLSEPEVLALFEVVLKERRSMLVERV